MDGLGFWLGRWICTWDGDRGTNTVTRDFEGHVITERFEALEPEPFSGLSASVQGRWEFSDDRSDREERWAVSYRRT